MKIIHCADCHLDSAMTELFPEKEAEKRRGEIRETFLRMITQADREGVEAILIAGDLFDTEKVHPVTANFIIDAVKRNSHIMFYYLAGNHDAYGFDMEDMSIQNWKTFGEDWTTYKMRGVTVSGRENLSGHLSEGLHLSQETFNIVMLHGDIDGEIRTEELKNQNIDYMALGHIHKGYDARLGSDCLMSYPGCLEGRGFDETGEHGYNLLEIDEKNGSFKKTFVPFAGRQIFIVPCDITGAEDTPEIFRRMERNLETSRCRENDIVRCVLTGDVSAEAEKNLPAIEAHFKDRFFKVQIKDSTTYTVSYEEYRNDLSLKGEFIRILEKTDDYTEEEKAAIIRCGLGLLKGEAVEHCI